VKIVQHICRCPPRAKNNRRKLSARPRLPSVDRRDESLYNIDFVGSHRLSSGGLIILLAGKISLLSDIGRLTGKIHLSLPMKLGIGFSGLGINPKGC
jgi:hypothetical protein